VVWAAASSVCETAGEPSVPAGERLSVFVFGRDGWLACRAVARTGVLRRGRWEAVGLLARADSLAVRRFRARTARLAFAASTRPAAGLAGAATNPCVAILGALLVPAAIAITGVTIVIAIRPKTAAARLRASGTALSERASGARGFAASPGACSASWSALESSPQKASAPRGIESGAATLAELV
jgi:hypothetical protein